MTLTPLTSGSLLAGQHDGSIHVLTVTGTQHCIRRLSGPVFSACLTSEEDICISAGSTIYLLERGSLRQIAESRGSRGVVMGLAALPNSRVASCGRDRTLRLWNMKNQREIASLEFDAWLGGVCVVPDGRLVVGDALGRLHWLEVLL